MKLLCGVLLFIGVFALNNAASSITLKRINTDQLLMKQLMDTRANNPSNAAPCFGIYLPIFDAILTEWQTSYELCTTTKDAQDAELNSEAQGNQTLITAAAQDVCSSMTTCSALDDSLDFLDCYSSVGNGNIKSLYEVTNNATDVAANLREQYRIVEVSCERCQNASERAYVESTADATDALNYCLANGPPPVDTTTAVPDTTTEEPTTADTTIDDQTTDPPTVEPEAGVEKEDLSRSAPVAPKLLTINKLNRFNRRQKN